MPACPVCCEFGDNFSIRRDLTGLASGRGADSVRASDGKDAVYRLRVTKIISGKLKIPCRLFAICGSCLLVAEIFEMIIQEFLLENCRHHKHYPYFSHLFSLMSCRASGRQLIFVAMLVAVFPASFKPCAGRHVAICPAVFDDRDKRAQA
jgi:hypothetical protein